VAATKTELFERIRRDSWREGLSIRALARKYGVHRRLVREALMHAGPAPRKTPERRSPQLESLKEVIDGWLRDDLDAPRKQRHTATRIHARLVEERGAGVSYWTVRDYVARRRPEIWEEAGRGPARVFVPQHHPPGQDAEVDFGELWVRLSGVMTKCYLFVLRLSYSGKAVHQVFATCGQEAFLEGHVHAFGVLGGVPAGQVRYDNLKAAVWKVLVRGRAREENPRWTAFRSHYRMFEPFYCLPGIEGAHEKGGVEGQVGYFRRNYLSPVPEVASLEELNTRIAAAEDAENGRRIGHRIRTIGQDLEAERPLLLPLPEEPYETGLVLTPRVDRCSTVTVRSCRYSVPARMIGRQARVVLRSSEVIVYDRHTEAARHPRLAAKGAEHLVLGHYLEVLMRKPGALPGSSALDQARASGAFTGAHDALWSAARKSLGEPAATRELIEVLLLHRHMDDADVIAGIGAALSVGAHTADVVAIEARKVAGARGEPPPGGEPGEGPGRVASLTRHRLTALPPDSRPLPTVDAYDQLLRHGQAGKEQPS
jgi:transposase